MRVIDVITGEIVCEDFFKNKRQLERLKTGKTYCIFHRYILESSLHETFTMIEVATGQEFLCATNRTMSIHLNIHLTDNENARIASIKMHKSYTISLQGRVFTLKNLDKDQVQSNLKADRKLYETRIRKHAKLFRENNKARLNERKALWNLNNKDKVRDYNREYVKARRSSDPGFKMKTNLRTRINQAIKNNSKAGTTPELLGCSIEYLKQYIESLFLLDMNWENYGENGWELDHIIPCSYFNLQNPEDQKRCFHYSNLQPLWASDNFKKLAFVPEDAEKILKDNLEKYPTQELSN